MMSGKRVLALYAAILFSFAVILCRLYFLAQNQTYAARAKAQSAIQLALPAHRCTAHRAGNAISGPLLPGRKQLFPSVFLYR